MMKTKKQISLLLIFFAITWSSFAFCQDFFPANFKNIITDDNTQDSQFVLNEFYLLEKSFGRINDSLYIHPESKEIISLLTVKNNNKVSVFTNYYTNTQLDKFRKRLQQNDLGFKKMNENLYQLTFENIKIQFLLEQNILIDGKKMNAIKYIFQYDKDAKSGLVYFPNKWIHPLQNTSWFFDVDYKKSTRYKNEYEMKIKLSKEKSLYKIEFTDDVHYKITYNDKNNKPQIFTGTYENNGKMSFNYDEIRKEKLIKTSAGTTVKLVEKALPHPTFVDVEELENIKKTAVYFQFLFSRSYKIGVSGNSYIFSETFNSLELSPAYKPSISN